MTQKPTYEELESQVRDLTGEREGRDRMLDALNAANEKLRSEVERLNLAGRNLLGACLCDGPRAMKARHEFECQLARMREGL